MNEILLVSNSLDFATDYVIAGLINRGVSYHRIDLDLLKDSRIALDPLAPRLVIEREGRRTVIDAGSIGSVLYRAPTHLRESSGSRYQPDELLARHQWAAFSRSLMVLDVPNWINHPVRTYQAENKPYQLRVASKIGFRVPQTIVSNCVPSDFGARFGPSRVAAVKALDSFLLRDGQEDLFFYTRTASEEELAAARLVDMPLIIQELIEDKTDIRITVVGNKVFACEIRSETGLIEGDWRLMKDRVIYRDIGLPVGVTNMCIELMESLGLTFGAIDMAYSRGEYYFLEINPTGEWSWLVSALGLPIDTALVEALCNGRKAV